MRGTGAETSVVGKKVLQWDWTEGASSSGFIQWTTRLGRIRMNRAKPFGNQRPDDGSRMSREAHVRF